uniref:Doublecortin domain-containing protein 2 n=3 Tax=Nothobranchius TaxID=28779 RepID=A0A8C6L2Z2_NOTFU
MSSDRPSFLSQPVVKNIFMFRNGDPYFEARRIVINEKRVCNFETLLREVTGGIQAPFGAVRTIYTPRRGHKVDCMESLQSGEQYVAAGKERFKKLDYLQIAPRKKKMMQTLPLQVKPLPPNRIIVSARFLKPIKEPCPIFVVANGDVFNPVVRLLIHQRMMEQFDNILELITEKMGLRVLGGVRSLFTYNGHQVTDGSELECGQLYVAVGRERFKKLPYSDLLFPRPKGTRRIKGMKAYSLPPIYRFAKQRGNSKSTVGSSDSGDGESKGSPQNPSSSSKEHLSSAVGDISQARLLSLRTRKSRQSITDNDDPESKAEDGDAEGEMLRDIKTDEKSEVHQHSTTESIEKKEEEVETPENISEVDVSANMGTKNEKQETNMEEEEKKDADEQNDEKLEELKAEEEVETPENISEVDVSANMGTKNEKQETNMEEEEKKDADEQNDEKLEELKAEEEVETPENISEVDVSANMGTKNEKQETNMEEEEKKDADEQNDEKLEELKAEEEVETPENISEVDVSANMGTKNEKQETNMEEEEKKDADEKNDEKLEELKAEEEETTENEQNVVTEESKSQVNDEEQEPNSSAADGDQTEENKEKEHILNTPSEAEVEQDSNTEEDKQEKDDGNREESSNINDEESGEEQRETEISNSPAGTRLENETKESADDRISSRSSIRDEDEKKTTEVTEERTANGEVSGDTCPGAAVKPENAEEDSSKKEED